MRDQTSAPSDATFLKSTCTALLTGFGPFPGVPYNVSEALVDAIGAKLSRRYPSLRFVTQALPTEWEIAPERAVDLICDLKPDIAIHFGVSAEAKGFVIETRAQNKTGRADAAGEMPLAEAIEPFGPVELATQLPAGRLCARLGRIGLTSRLSRDAGTYLCNAVFYRSVLTQTELGSGGRSGFVHLPVAVENAPRGRRRPGSNRVAVLDFDDAVRGGAELVAACLGR